MTLLFFCFMAYHAFTNNRNTSIGEWITSTLMIVPAIIIGITVHEFAHAYSAYKLGDMTPKLQNRVTLNPIAHIDPVGLIALLFAGFGWGKPVQVNPYAFKNNPKLCNIIVDLSGVVTNFVLAFLFTGVYKFLVTSYAFVQYDVLITIVYNIIVINLVLMIFNLLPVPPLDGFGIITEIFNLRRFSWYQNFYNNGMIILILLIMFDITSGILLPAITAILRLFFTIWGLM